MAIKKHTIVIGSLTTDMYKSGVSVTIKDSNGNFSSIFDSGMSPIPNPGSKTFNGVFEFYADDQSKYYAEVLAEAPISNIAYTRQAGGWIESFIPVYYCECGEAIAQCGEPVAQCGNYYKFEAYP